MFDNIFSSVSSLSSRFISTIVKRFQIENGYKLLLWLSIYILSGCGVQIYLNSLGNFMGKYQYFIQQSGTMAFLPLSGAVVIYKMIFTNDITREMCSWRFLPKIAVMALFDSLEDFAVVVAAFHASVAVQSLLPQAILPLTMAFSVWLLKAKFSFGQYFAALMILAGVTIVLIPKFIDPDRSTSALFAVLIFGANVPGALSSIFKQVSLQDKNMDVFYLNTVICIFQVIINIIIAPLNAIEAVSGPGAMPLDQIPSQFRDGFLCLINKLPNDGTLQCSETWWRWLLFVFCVFISNWALLQVVKFGSASFMYVGAALQLPITNLLSTSPDIMGGAMYAQTINSYDIGSLFCVIAGLVVYAISDESVDEYEERDVPPKSIENIDQTGNSAVLVVQASIQTSESEVALLGRSRNSSRSSFKSVFVNRFGIIPQIQVHSEFQPMIPKRDARLAYFSRLGISEGNEKGSSRSRSPVASSRLGTRSPVLGSRTPMLGSRSPMLRKKQSEEVFNIDK